MCIKNTHSVKVHRSFSLKELNPKKSEDQSFQSTQRSPFIFSIKTNLALNERSYLNDNFKCNAIESVHVGRINTISLLDKNDLGRQGEQFIGI